MSDNVTAVPSSRTFLMSDAPRLVFAVQSSGRCEGGMLGCSGGLTRCKCQCGNGVMFLPAVRCLSGLPPRNFPRDLTWSDFRQARVTGQHPQEPTTSQSVEAVRALTNHRSHLLAEFSANG